MIYDLSRSFKVKCDASFVLLIFGFLLMFNCNIEPKLLYKI